jgi:glucoamylase
MLLSFGGACAPSGSHSSATTSRALGASHESDSDAGRPGEGRAAPGAPGAPSVWAPARKSFLGTAASDGSRVYFSGYRGAVSEVFYPTLDAVQTIALELMVGDAAGTFVDPEGAANYAATRPEPRSLRWQVTTENAEHGWRLEKDVFTDPERDALVLHGTLEALGGRDVSDLRLYVRHDPALDNSGGGDSSHTRRAHGRTFLVATDNGRASALGVSLPWVTREAHGHDRSMVSNGFAGVSDAASDLQAGEDVAMDWVYDAAVDGNVGQLGWLDLGAGEASRRHFDVVLGFGASEREAMDTADAVLDRDLDALARRYDEGWQSYAASLDDQGGTADDQYYLAAMTLRAIRDKASGAMIAGMGTPWGETRGDDDNGGYHLVWARDLFKFANALITAGDLATARSAVRYLFGTLVQTTDCGVSEEDAAGCPNGYSRVGRFPQNAWLNGDPYWTSTQLDEQAMPILLAWRSYELGDADTRSEIDALWPRMRATAEFILATGPWTPQERWEESSGYSPSTIAAEIAGLVAAAELARLQGDDDSAARYLSVADYWEENVSHWTFTTSGPHGDHRYYIRLNPSKPRGGSQGLSRFDAAEGPDAPLSLTIGNGGGDHDQRAIVDGGFLELVRLGVKAPTDPFVVDSLPEYDAILKQSIAGKGDAWFRYNFDGYGETNLGGPWDGEAGRGRLWPIFTAERGMYEIARSASGVSGAPYLPMLRAFATPEGLIPEQVWTENASITGWQVLTPEPYVPGTATGSIAPLSWAMGEYMSLLAAVRAGRVVDIPESVCRRYDTCELPPRPGQVSVVLEIGATLGPGDRIYVSGNTPSLGGSSSGPGSKPSLGLPAQLTSAGLWRAVLDVPADQALELQLHRRSASGAFTPESSASGGRRTLRSPATGRVTLRTTARF